MSKKSVSVDLASAVGADFRQRLDEQRKDDADKRQLRGKHAPPEGICRSAVVLMDGQLVKPCGGRVIAAIGHPITNLIGGGPQQAFVKHWYCEGCGVMYHAPPKDKS